MTQPGIDCDDDYRYASDRVLMQRGVSCWTVHGGGQQGRFFLYSKILVRGKCEYDASTGSEASGVGCTVGRICHERAGAACTLP